MRTRLLKTSVLRLVLICALLGAIPLRAQNKRLWVLRAPGEMVEYDLATLTVKPQAANPAIKLPPEAMKSPQSVSVNHQGQILFAPTVSLPLTEDDANAPHKAWLWNGRASTLLDISVS